MVTYTMKAKTGKFGATFQRPPFDYGKIMERLVVALLISLLCILWFRWSIKQDQIRDQSFEKCHTKYYNYALSTEYIPYMQDCMN